MKLGRIRAAKRSVRCFEIQAARALSRSGTAAAPPAPVSRNDTAWTPRPRPTSIARIPHVGWSLGPPARPTHCRLRRASRLPGASRHLGPAPPPPPCRRVSDPGRTHLSATIPTTSPSSLFGGRDLHVLPRIAFLPPRRLLPLPVQRPLPVRAAPPALRPTVALRSPTCRPSALPPPVRQPDQLRLSPYPSPVRGPLPRVAPS